MSVGDHSKRFKSEDECSGERERGREREFAGRFVFHGLISDRNQSKIVDFLCENAVKFDFSDKMSISYHFKRLKKEKECSGERERESKIESLLGASFFMRCYLTHLTAKFLIFCVKMQ